MQNHQNENLSLNRFEDTSQHAQPILPNLADFSACVQPALQNGPGKVFHFDDFACPYSSFTLLKSTIEMSCTIILLRSSLQ